MILNELTLSDYPAARTGLPDLPCGSAQTLRLEYPAAVLELEARLQHPYASPDLPGSVRLQVRCQSDGFRVSTTTQVSCAQLAGFGHGLACRSLTSGEPAQLQDTDRRIHILLGRATHGSRLFMQLDFRDDGRFVSLWDLPVLASQVEWMGQWCRHITGFVTQPDPLPVRYRS